ncbi:MAG: Amylo-alpha6-glucosidase [Candidatus Adlerbacteria bacterium]|nr:Amylo-alpha6-glucosidase [Candidatus Adlerbacteria bacterium]
MSPDVRQELWKLGLRSIESLEVPEGILASGRDEVYGCIFGRDSLITALSLLRAHETQGNPYFITLARKILLNLSNLQGTAVNIESGEEPGKMIHELRPTNHERLTQSATNPWYVYPDNVMRNYDSVDSTPLYLMAMHAYLRASGDAEFIAAHMPNIRAALAWVQAHSARGQDFITYTWHPDRTSGGLKTQSWMDSIESVFFESSPVKPHYPLAPVEAQAYAWVAMRAWSNFFANSDTALSYSLRAQAETLKEKFNAAFVLRRGGRATLAFAIDGRGRPLTSARSSMGHVLFAVWQEDGREPEAILNSEFIPDIASRLMQPDLFVPAAGIRTLSSRSRKFAPHSYHNGTIWPHDSAMVAHGLAMFGYTAEAARITHALLQAYAHFATPIELFVYKNRTFKEYVGACRTQAWSAAALLTLATDTSVSD